MTTAYSYIRFSSAEQKKGDSLRRQMQLSEEYALEHNLTLDDTLHLHDLGISAFKGSNITKGALVRRVTGFSLTVSDLMLKNFFVPADFSFGVKAIKIVARDNSLLAGQGGPS